MVFALLYHEEAWQRGSAAWQAVAWQVVGSEGGVEVRWQAKVVWQWLQV